MAEALIAKSLETRFSSRGERPAQQSGKTEKECGKLEKGRGILEESRGCRRFRIWEKRMTKGAGWPRRMTSL
eukprot:3945930-Pleurochrysis_carterae.AAC.2